MRHQAAIREEKLKNRVATTHFGKYFMFNAAVASEALDGTLQAGSSDNDGYMKYVPSDWHGYTNACWAANWFRWFQGDPSDARGRMGWPGYFSAAINNVGTIYNYYSSGDLVFMEAGTPPGLTAGMFHWPTLSWTWPFINLNMTEEAHSWQKQETRKGIDPIAGTLKGGWGFHCWYETVGGEPVQEYYTATQANAMAADGSITNSPVFSYGGTPLNSRNASQDDIWLSLAKYVPAVSAPIGGSSPFDDNNVDLDDATNVARPNGWGRINEIYGQKWLHSDIKDMAFFYVYPFYIDLATKGDLR